MMNNVKSLSVLLAFGGTLVVAGCGGGSSSQPMIIVKPEQAGVVALVDPNPVEQVLAPGPGLGSGGLAGVIKYTGPAGKPGLPSGYTDKDKFCTNNKARIVDESLIVGPGGGLKNVVIYLPRKPRKYTSPVPKTAAIFDQKFCTFVPHVLTVHTGQTVELRNNDGTSHNTHLFPNNNPQQSNSLPPGGKPDKYVYENSEVVPVKVKCDAHPWMTAYHVVLNHPLVAITDKNGAFKISGIPAGKYKFKIWHEKSGPLGEVSITVKPGKTASLNRSYGPSELSHHHGPRPKVIVLTQR